LAKTEVENPTVKRMVDRMYEMSKAKNRPAIYNQALVDNNSDSPNASILHEVISLMRLYVSKDVSDADAKKIFAIDRTLSRDKLPGPWSIPAHSFYDTGCIPKALLAPLGETQSGENKYDPHVLRKFGGQSPRP